MQIACPECQTKYNVAAVAIGKAGRDVRCVRCGHTWYQTLPEEEMQTPSEPVLTVRPIPRGSALPALLTAKKPSRALWAALAACWLVALTSGIYVLQPLILQKVPQMGALYNALGIGESKGIVLADLKMERATSDRYDRYNITGALKNEAKSARQIPTVRILFTDKNMIPIESWDFKQPGKTIAAGETMPFAAKGLEVKSRRQTYATVQVGNGAELALRN